MVDTPIPVKKSASPNWWMKGKGAGTELDPSEAYVVDSIAEGHLSTIAASTTCTHDSITLTVVNTEYNIAIPTNCKKLTFRCVDSTKIAPGSDIHYAWATGKVAGATLPFMLLDGGSVYSESNLLLTSKTLYVAGVTAGDIVLLEMWS
jgi:hypothetical protein